MAVAGGIARFAGGNSPVGQLGAVAGIAGLAIGTAGAITVGVAFDHASLKVAKAFQEKVGCPGAWKD